MRYFINNEGNPMTNQERVQKYPSGKCPLCNHQEWETAYYPEEDETARVCQNCETLFPFKEVLTILIEKDEDDYYINNEG